MPLIRQPRAFGLVRGGGGVKGVPSAGGVPDLQGCQSTSAHGRTRRGPARRRGRHTGALRAQGASAKDIFDAGDEDAGAAGLAPDALVACSGRTVIVVAREELALVDP